MRSSSDDALAAADRCLATFNNSQRLKSKAPTKRKAKDEVLYIFKRSKAAAKIPTTEKEKDDLLRAGLVEKEVEFFYMEIGAEAFRDLLHDKFPPLRCGGFEFLKCIPNSRNMEVLSPVTLLSPLALKTIVGTTKRTYIRPLQQDLGLSAIFDLPSG
uniref:Uncharacterized protein n=1 Tax=Amphimedon queenslandica TaxID=400682 RepID=A0A1X7V4V6_AMPQE